MNCSQSYHNGPGSVSYRLPQVGLIIFIFYNCRQPLAAFSVDGEEEAALISRILDLVSMTDALRISEKWMERSKIYALQNHWCKIYGRHNYSWTGLIQKKNFIASNKIMVAYTHSNMDPPGIFYLNCKSSR